MTETPPTPLTALLQSATTNNLAGGPGPMGFDKFPKTIIQACGSGRNPVSYTGNNTDRKSGKSPGQNSGPVTDSDIGVVVHSDIDSVFSSGAATGVTSGSGSTTGTTLDSGSTTGIAPGCGSVTGVGVDSATSCRLWRVEGCEHRCAAWHGHYVFNKS